MTPDGYGQTQGATGTAFRRCQTTHAIGRPSVRQQWLTADYPEKRRLLEIVFLNSRLDGVTLVPTMRKPFDVLAEGLVSEKSRDDKTAIELFLTGIWGWEAGLRRKLENGKSG
jgi:hypothetical protein